EIQAESIDCLGGIGRPRTCRRQRFGGAMTGGLTWIDKINDASQQAGYCDDGGDSRTGRFQGTPPHTTSDLRNTWLRHAAYTSMISLDLLATEDSTIPSYFFSSSCTSSRPLRAWS